MLFQVDARYCEFFLSKLNDESIKKYCKAIKNIKKYTKIEGKIEEQISFYNKKSENYIAEFKRKINSQK